MNKHSSIGLVLFYVSIGQFISGMQSRIINVSLPTLASALNTDISGIQWTIVVYQLTFVGLLLSFGRLGDTIGRIKIYSTGFIFFQ